jgi:hypothetical protein
VFNQLFSVLEFDAFDDLGELVRAIQASPILSRRLAQLEDHGGAVAGLRPPLVLVVLSRTVAKVLSMGLVVRMCFQCSAEKS